MKFFDYKCISEYKKMLSKEKNKILFFSFLLIISSFLTFPVPFLIKQIIDISIPNQDMKNLIEYIIIITILIIISNLTVYFTSTFFLKLNTKIIFEFKGTLLKKILISYRNHTEDKNIGYFLSRIEEDTGRLNNLFIDRCVSLFSDFFKFLFGIIAICMLSIQLAVITFFCLPIFIILTIYFGEKMAAASKKLYEVSSENSDTIIKILEKITFFKIYIAYNYAEELFYKSSKIYKNQILKNGKISYMNNLIVGILLSIMPILSIALGGYLVILGYISLGTIIAYNSISLNIFNPVQRFINFSLNLKTARVSMERLEEILSLKEEPSSIEDKVLHMENFKEISFNDIVFVNDGRKILNSLNLTINRGEKIGIYGKSGSGKSTLVKILTGIYTINSGNIFVDGHSIHKDEIINLRSIISCVEQEPVLLKDTIKNNIILGDSVVEFDRYSRLLNIHEEIIEKDKGYEAVIGKDIMDLSLGQKQRIAIVRGVSRKKPLMVFDEVTSSLDSKNEENVIKIFKEDNFDRTILVISHKIDSFIGFDKVYELLNGKLILRHGNINNVKI